MIHHPSSRRERSLVAAASVATLLATGVFATAFAQATPPQTIEEGKLNVAFNGDMPMTGWKDGKLVGVDGGILSMVAEDLGLEIVPNQMEWSAEIQSVKQGKSDLMLGGMSWTPERAEVLALTDPIYYFPVMLVQKESTDYTTTEDMAGRTVGTIVGYAVIPELKAVPDIGELKLYDTPDALTRDVLAGRVDMAILDPLSTQMAIQNRPEWGIKQLPIEADVSKYPVMGSRQLSVIGVSQDNEDLLQALNREIREAWETCSNVEVASNYGLGAEQWFTPPDENIRAGVDRGSDWAYPRAPEECFSQ